MLRLLATSILALLLCGCSFLSGYHPPIQQGNVIASQRIASIKHGMSKQTVQQILGSPVLNNLFENNNWYYVSSYQEGNGPIDVKRTTITFKKNRVVNITQAKTTINK